MGASFTRRSALVLICLLAVVLALALAMGLGRAVAADESPSPSGEKVVYRAGWLADVDNMNPFIGYVSTSYEIWYLTYDALVGFDPATLVPMKGEDSPGLATDWSVSDDGLSWTFTIRQGATWHDGEPLTAKDVAFTYNCVIDNELENFTSYVQYIDKAVVVDDYTVRFDCSQPKPDMIRHWLPILPEHIWSKVPPEKLARGYTNNPPFIGSGPFKCVTWKKHSYVKLVANRDYWGGAPRIDELYFDYYTNADTMVQDLKAGAIAGCTGMLPAQMKQLENEPGIAAHAIYVNGFDELGFNCYADGPSKGHPALKDWKFRQALNWAVDLDKVCEVGYGGYARPATTIITAEYYHDPDWHWEPPAEEKYTYDPETAKQKLDEAGYTDADGDGVREYKGKPIKLRLIARSESIASQKNAKLIAGWFKAVGIKVEISVMDDGALMDRQYNYEHDVFTPDYDMFMWGWYLDFDPGSMLSYFTKRQIENWSDCNWWDEEYERVFKEQGGELDTGKRKELVDRLQQILYQQSPYIVLAYSDDLEAYDTDDWEGYIKSPDPNGNVLFMPYGNCGSVNFVSIRPKVGAAQAEGGAGATLWVAIGVVVVVVAVVVWLVLRARRPRAMEE